MKIIPKRVQRAWRKTFKTWKGENYFCPVCENNLKYLDPLSPMYTRQWKRFGFEHGAEQEMLNFKNYTCPVCKSKDRDRLIAVYFNQQFSNSPKGQQYNFLEIGPSSSLKPFFQKFSQISHRTADLFDQSADDIGLDITDMHIYQNEAFDIILCSHVLEHVKEDQKAMSELFRILKPNGQLIVLSPIFLHLDSSYENPSPATDNERWKHFGQNDHVRLYSKSDFINRLVSNGFSVKALDVNYFGKEVFDKIAVTEKSVLYVANRMGV